MSRKIGRPSTYTEEVGLRIANHVRSGSTIHEAARSEAVCRATVDGWVEKHPAFAALLSMCQARAVTDLLDIVRGHAQDDWRAAAWLLEKLEPQRFGRRVEIALKLELDTLSNEDLYEIAGGSYPGSALKSNGLIEGAPEESPVLTSYSVLDQ